MGPAELAQARLVARHMADAGSARGEVVVHLRRVFGITQPHLILDEIFAEPVEVRL